MDCGSKEVVETLDGVLLHLLTENVVGFSWCLCNMLRLACRSAWRQQHRTPQTAIVHTVACYAYARDPAASSLHICMAGGNYSCLSHCANAYMSGTISAQLAGQGTAQMVVRAGLTQEQLIQLS